LKTKFVRIFFGRNGYSNNPFYCTTCEVPISKRSNLRDEGGDEDEEDVVDEEGRQQDGADLEARQPQNFQHVDAKKRRQQQPVLVKNT
jgi:hypothetical protein